MIDYLLLYADDAARAAAYPAPEGSPPTWTVGGIDVLPVTVTLSDATYDEDGNQISPAVIPSGSWMRLRAPERSTEIEALPNCLLCVDADLAAAGEAYVHFHRFQPDTLLGRISPMFAGDEYTIPAGSPASVLDASLIATLA